MNHGGPVCGLHPGVACRKKAEWKGGSFFGKTADTVIWYWNTLRVLSIQYFSDNRTRIRP